MFKLRFQFINQFLMFPKMSNNRKRNDHKKGNFKFMDRRNI